VLQKSSLEKKVTIIQFVHILNKMKLPENMLIMSMTSH